MGKEVDQLVETLTESQQCTLKARKSSLSKAGVSTRELELALTVLLVDLASIDQKFDITEYNTIRNGLSRVFGTSGEEMQAMVHKANLILANLRGTSRFAELLKRELTLGQRRAVLEVIEEVIHADGSEDGFEVYLRHKFQSILGITEDEVETEDVDTTAEAS